MGLEKIQTATTNKFMRYKEKKIKNLYIYNLCRIKECIGKAYKEAWRDT